MPRPSARPGITLTKRGADGPACDRATRRVAPTGCRAGVREGGRPERSGRGDSASRLRPGHDIVAGTVLRGAAVVALLAFGLFLTPAAPAVTATDATAGRVVLCRPLANADRVGLAFTHSMYGGDVTEEFVATEEHRLRRVSLTTANAAAAEYYAYTANVIRDGGRFRVDVPAEEFDEIVVRVSRPGGHRLLLGHDQVDLLAVAGDGHRVRLGIRSGRLAVRLLGDRC